MSRGLWLSKTWRCSCSFFSAAFWHCLESRGAFARSK